MATRSSIDSGSIVLGKIYVAGIGSPSYENAMEMERMRLQVLAGQRLRREAERQRIRVEREARTRVQSEASRGKCAEEHHADLQTVEAGSQYQRHLERHQAEKLRSQEFAQQENRIRDPERYQHVLEQGRQADMAAQKLRAGSLEQRSVDGWLRIQDMTALERDLLRPAGFSERELAQEQILLTAREIEWAGAASSETGFAFGTEPESGATFAEAGELLREGVSAVPEQDQDQDEDSLPQQCEHAAELSELEPQQIRERRHYSSISFGV